MLIKQPNLGSAVNSGHEHYSGAALPQPGIKSYAHISDLLLLQKKNSAMALQAKRKPGIFKPKPKFKAKE
jgi:hypothetical protein